MKFFKKRYLLLTAFFIFSFVLPVFAMNTMDAVNSLRQQMLSRTSRITIELDSNASQNTADDIFQKAVAYTGNGKEGDYLLVSSNWPWSSPSISVSGKKIIYSLSYLTTAAQESEVDRAVSNALNSLNLKNKSDYEKICLINDWIVDSITYVDAGLNNTGSSYAAFIDKKSPCTGYALAFYRLCVDSGMEARIVYRDNKQHVWNLVKLKDQWYHVDCCGSDYSNAPRRCFLKGSEWWTNTGLPLHSDFNSYKIAAKDYNPSAGDASTQKPPASTQQPASTTQKPAATTQKPAATTQKPAASTQQPASSTQKPHDTSTSQKKYKVGAPVIQSTKNQAKGIKLVWKKGKDAKRYKIYRRISGGKYQFIKITTATSYLDKKTSTGKRYQYKIIAYDKKGNRSKSSISDVIYRLTLPKALNLKKKGAGQLEVRFHKVGGANGYLIQYSLDKKMKEATSVKTTKQKTILKDLISKKAYYVRVRAYKMVKGKTYYSMWTKVMHKKVK